MKKRYWKILFSIGVFITLMFSCFGGSIAMAFSDMQNSSGHDMPCCTEQYSVNSNLHTYDFVLTNNIFQKIIFSLGCAILFVFLFRLSKKFNIFLYLKRIKLRYGGFKLFNYFSSLFKIGILHPKTW